MQATASVCLLLLGVLICSGAEARNSTTTPSKHLWNFLSDRSLVTRQINCVLGRAKCDRLGGQLKKAIPEVVNRNCARCTTAQASNANKLIAFVRNHYPVAYRDILNKYRINKSQNQRNQRPKDAAKPPTTTPRSNKNVTTLATNSIRRKSTP